MNLLIAGVLRSNFLSQLMILLFHALTWLGDIDKFTIAREYWSSTHIIYRSRNIIGKSEDTTRYLWSNASKKVVAFLPCVC